MRAARSQSSQMQKKPHPRSILFRCFNYHIYPSQGRGYIETWKVACILQFHNSEIRSTNSNLSRSPLQIKNFAHRYRHLPWRNFKISESILNFSYSLLASVSARGAAPLTVKWRCSTCCLFTRGEADRNNINGGTAYSMVGWKLCHHKSIVFYTLFRRVKICIKQKIRRSTFCCAKEFSLWCLIYNNFFFREEYMYLCHGLIDRSGNSGKF